MPNQGFVGADFFSYRLETNGYSSEEAIVQMDVFATSPLLEGDADRDGKVDLDDFAALRAMFGAFSGWEGGDFDRSGKTDLRDFAILKSRFGDRL